VPPYEQTAALCGLRFLPPLVLHGAHAVSEADLQAHAEVYRQRLARYPQWSEMAALGDCPDCRVPDSDRPQEA